MPDFETFHVGLKVLLKKGDEYLFLTDAANGKLDLPGGRIDDNENDSPLSDIIGREVKYELGCPIFQYRARTKSSEPYRFITVYSANYLGGVIRLSGEHSSYQWVNGKDIDLRKEFFLSGEAYEAFKSHFDALQEKYGIQTHEPAN